MSSARSDPEGMGELGVSPQTDAGGGGGEEDGSIIANDSASEVSVWSHSHHGAGGSGDGVDRNDDDTGGRCCAPPRIAPPTKWGRHQAALEPWSDRPSVRDAKPYQEFVHLYNRVAALTPHCSGAVREAIYQVARMVRAAWMSRRRLRYFMTPYCLKVLRLTFLIAQDQTTRGSKYELGAPDDILLDALQYQSTVAHGIEQGARTSFPGYGSSTPDEVYIQFGQHMRVLARLALQIYKDVRRPKHHRLAAATSTSTLSPGILASPWASTSFSCIYVYDPYFDMMREAEIEIMRETGELGEGEEPEQEEAPPPEPYDAILEMFQFVRGISWQAVRLGPPGQPSTSGQSSSDGIEDIVDLVRAPNDPEHELYDALVRFYLAHDIHALIAHDRIAHHLRRPSPSFKRQVEDAFKAACSMIEGDSGGRNQLHVKQVLQEPGARLIEYFIGILIALSLKSLWQEATRLGPFLTLALRQQCQNQARSLQARVRLANGLAAHSTAHVLNHCHDIAFAGAKEAAALIEPRAHESISSFASSFAYVKMLYLQLLATSPDDKSALDDELCRVVGELRRVWKMNPSDLELCRAFIHALGKQAELCTNRETAIAAHRQAIALYHSFPDPMRLPYLHKIVHHLETLGDKLDDHSEAIAAYEEALQMYPRLHALCPRAYETPFYELHLRLAHRHEQLANYTQALEALDGAASVRSWNGGADLHVRQHRAELHFLREDYASARTEADYVLAHVGRPSWAETRMAHLRTMCVFLLDGVEATATTTAIEEAFERARERCKPDPAVESGLVTYADPAMAPKPRTLRHTDLYMAALGQRGAVRCAQGRFEEALEDGARAIKLCEDYIRHHGARWRATRMQFVLAYNRLFYGATLGSAGRSEEAVVQLRASLDAFQHHEMRSTGRRRAEEKTARLLLARLLARLHRPVEAEEQLAAARAICGHGFAHRLGAV